MRHLKKRAGASPLSSSRSWNCPNLPFQLDLDDLEWRFAGVFRQVGKGIHVLNRPGVRVDVFTPSVRVGELVNLAWASVRNTRPIPGGCASRIFHRVRT